MKFLERFSKAPIPSLEADDTELVFSRLKDRKIRAQIIGLWNKWQRDNPDRFRFELEMHLNMFASSIRLQGRGLVSEQQLNHILDLLIQQEETRTLINRWGENPIQSQVNGIVPNWTAPDGSKQVTDKQMKIIVAHEKSHAVRFVLYDEMFTDGFDQSRIRPVMQKKHSELTGEERVIEYLFGGSDEVIERMSQLKNYFGFKGSEKFTKRHLDYARLHYIEDTGMDNNMRVFFDMITPETEERFLYAINNGGV
jgi:hypothetical protein